ncbi:MAG: SHOCT domain-containing protein [Pseudolabrys sp.]|nr:SHOCT domain-containing protein [Pseudolabrys sp.]
MQEVQTQSEAKGKCCGKSDGHRSQRRGKCGSTHKHEANAATDTPLQILQQRFARGEIDTAEFEEKRRLIANA